MIGLGLVTYNRPDYFERSSMAIVDKLAGVIDFFVIYNDGSRSEFDEKYGNVYDKLNSIKGMNIRIIAAPKNKGVAVAKNRCLSSMLEAGCDYLFLSEDDIIVKDAMAIKGYIELSGKTKIEHFNFAHHGPLNKRRVKRVNDVEYYHDCVGAWSFYTRNSLEKVGLMDEKFKNAWEHVEHTARLSRAGLTTPFWLFSDHRKSAEWLDEIPESIDNSAIKYTNKSRRNKNMEKGLDYWKKKDGIGIPSLDPAMMWR